MKDFAAAENKDDRIAAVRDEVFAALRGEHRGFRGARAVRRLRSLAPQRRQDMSFLKAKIATDVVLRARARQTLRALDRLRQICDSAGETARFDDFATRISDHLGDEQLTWHGYTEATFQNLDHDAIWTDLAQTIAGIQALGYPVFLHSGTLLGVVRDGKLIDHDDDIDLALVLNADTPEAAAAEWQELTKRLDQAGLLDPDADPDRPAGILTVRPTQGVAVDLMLCWIEGDDVHIFPHTAGDLTRAQVFPLGTCPVTGLPIPANPDAMLAVNYGPDWRTPDPLFVFPHVERRTHYQTFLEGLET